MWLYSLVYVRTGRKPQRQVFLDMAVRIGCGDKNDKILVTMSLFTRLQEQFEFTNPGAEVMKLFSCSTQLSMKFKMLINIEIAKIDGIFKFNSLEPAIYPANK